IISSALCLRTVSLYLTQFLFLILFQLSFLFFFFFFFTDTATTEIYTLSLHDALPIFGVQSADQRGRRSGEQHRRRLPLRDQSRRSEEHTSELQSRENLVCRLLLEKKKKKKRKNKNKNKRTNM